MTDTSATSLSTPPAFVAGVLDADAAPLIIKGCAGVVVYVHVLTGALPSAVRNVLVRTDGWPWVSTLYGRPEKGAFAPTAARLTVSAGRTYPVTVLASLPALGMMRPYLRAGLNPPPQLDPAAIPVALEGLPRHFRATAGELSAVGASGDRTEVDQQELLAQLQRRTNEALLAAWQLRPPPGGEVTHHATEVERVLDALGDERETVRDAAANYLRPFAARLPLAPFLAAIQDKRDLNAAACVAAATVFAAHPDEVPIEALLDLYQHMGAGVHRVLVHMVVVQAFGRLGARASVEVIELLSDTLQGRGASHDIRVRMLAANALGDLGERAPIEPLIAGMEDHQPEVASAAARALARHPVVLSDEVRARAQTMSDVQTVRQMRYERFLPPHGD
jgi:hypothetical protein